MSLDHHRLAPIMKLNELGPMLDPRKPLRLAGPPRPALTAVPRALDVAARTRPVPPASADLAHAGSVDLAEVDRCIELIGGHPELVGRTHHHWQQSAVRLHRRARPADVRTRALRAVDLFTGASTGILAALWRQESEQQSTQLRAELARRWQHLQAARAGVGPAAELASMLDEIDDIRAQWAQLEEIGVVDRVFDSSTVIALSPGAAATMQARRRIPDARFERAFQRRTEWGSGVVWLPDRRVFLGWSADEDKTELVEIDAAEMAEWTRSLQTDTPRILTWRRLTIPAAAKLSQNAPWTALAADITRLLQVVQLPAASSVPQLPTVPNTLAVGGRGGRVPTTVRGRIEAPTTRFVIAASEGRAGVEPFDLATGAPATAEWLRARYRQTWSAEQNRFVRTWTDAYTKSDRRPPNETVLVTVMPVS